MMVLWNIWSQLALFFLVTCFALLNLMYFFFFFYKYLDYANYKRKIFRKYIRSILKKFGLQNKLLHPIITNANLCRFGYII